MLSLHSRAWQNAPDSDEAMYCLRRSDEGAQEYPDDSSEKESCSKSMTVCRVSGIQKHTSVNRVAGNGRRVTVRWPCSLVTSMHEGG